MGRVASGVRNRRIEVRGGQRNRKHNETIVLGEVSSLGARSKGQRKPPGIYNDKTS